MRRYCEEQSKQAQQQTREQLAANNALLILAQREAAQLKARQIVLGAAVTASLLFNKR